MRVAHISDLHVSSREYIEECGENLVKLLNSIKPEIVVITGDLTDQGYLHEYEIAEKYLRRIKSDRLVIPGNHDSRNGGDILFEEIFGTRFPVYENEELVILGIDSSEPDIDDGHIGREHYGRVREALDREGKIRIVAMHHHLIPIPNTGRERNIPVDAGDFLRVCIESNVDLVLSGHKHTPWVWKLENSYFITSGTATTRRLKGRAHPTFNLFEVEEGEILLKEIRTTDGEVEETRKLFVNHSK